MGDAALKDLEQPIRCRWPEQKPISLDVDALRGILSSALSIGAEDLFSRTRGPGPLAFMRQLGMYLLHVELGCNIFAVSSVFKRDRTTCLYGIMAVEQIRECSILNQAFSGIGEAVKLEVLKRGKSDD